MTKRLFKKYLSAFGCTLKDGKVCGKPRRRHGIEFYLLPSHPLASRRNGRSAKERARVLPAIIKAKIRDDIKTSFVRQVREHEPMNLPAWSEQGGKPRLRLYSAARYFIDIPNYAGDLQAHRAEIGRRFSALFRERPQVIGKRVQSGNRIA